MIISLSSPLRGAMADERCRWCGRTTSGPVPICDARCFSLALWCGWFEPMHLWARRNSKSNGRDAATENEEMSDYRNKGVFFKNTRKQEGSAQPDYRGKLNVEGTEYELAGWIREDKNGGKYLALSVKPVDANNQSHSRTDATDAPF